MKQRDINNVMFYLNAATIGLSLVQELMNKFQVEGDEIILSKEELIAYLTDDETYHDMRVKAGIIDE